MKRYFQIKVRTDDGRCALYHVYTDMAKTAFDLAKENFRTHGVPRAVIHAECLKQGRAKHGKDNYVHLIRKWGWK